MKKTILALIAAAAIGISGCGPTLEKKADLTGDGIEDVIVGIAWGLNNGTYLFIGQEDGSFVRARKHEERSGAEYFLTDDNRTYFFDGKFYVEAKKYSNNEISGLEEAKAKQVEGGRK